MFLGHYGVAFALKRAEPKVSLGTLFLAVQLVDLLWGICLLLGWEEVRIAPGAVAATPLEFVSYPITHSLLAGVLWAIAAAAVYYSWPTTDTARHWPASLVVGAAVLSHWFLDLVAHVRDLPLTTDDSVKLGFGLWRSLAATVVVELLVFLGGLALYLTLRSRRYVVPTGRVLVVAVVLLVSYLAVTFGAVPGSVRQIAIGDIVSLLVFTALGAWANTRVAAAEPSARQHAHAHAG
jgi:hypothetical protein